MRKSCFIFLLVTAVLSVNAQQPVTHPCANDTMYQQFDFWIGNWEVYSTKGKAGTSRIERILDSCIILENWTSEKSGYAGKSFNTYNAATRQWQQTWVDNAGGTTEYLRGYAAKDKMIFFADKVAAGNGKFFLRRLSFFKLNNNTVRQLGERSDDNGSTWTTEYDLEYRRK